MEQINNSEETINVKEIIFKYSKSWYYFFLCIVFCLFGAFLYNRYTTPLYSGSTTILIRDDSNASLGAENLLEGLELFSGKKNLKNEIGILESYDLIAKTIQDLHFQTSYFHVGKIRTAEVYKNVPFQAIVDSNTTQTLGIAFHVHILENNSFELKTEAKNVRQYIPVKKTFTEQTRVSFKYSAKHSFGETIETENFSFKLQKQPIFDESFIGKEFLFFFHDINNLTKKRLKNLTIAPINKEASIININSKGEVARKELDFLNQLASNYIQLGLDEKNQMAANTITFINQQLQDVSDSLLTAENKLENFKENNPKLELSYKDYGTFFQIEQLEKERSILEVNDKYYKALLNYLTSNDNVDKIVAPSAMGINDPLLNSLINDLSRLYAEKSTLALNTREEHPVFQSLISKIESTKKSLIENVNNIINTSDIAIQNVNNRIIQEEKLISNLPQSERVLVNIQRKFNLNESIYTYLLEKRAEAAIALAGNVADHKVLDIARLESRLPISPKKNISYLLGLILGFIIPIVWITIKDFFNDKVISKNDIEKITSYPIIGNILHSDKGSNLIVLNNPKSAISESFRAIRTNIQYLNSDKKKKIISITSSISGEGKTYCSMNLASVFALSGSKTLLIGADMRKPKIFSDFQLPNDKGLSNYLSNQIKKKEIIQKSNIENLDIILSGPTPPNPAELLDKQLMKSFLKELQEEYKYIVIDTPPIGLVTDSLILMKYTDVNLYMIRQNYSTKGMLEYITTLFEQKEIKHINLVFNDIDEKSMNYGYGYGYGYGYYDEDQEKEKGFFKKLFS